MAEQNRSNKSTVTLLIWSEESKFLKEYDVTGQNKILLTKYQTDIHTK